MNQERELNAIGAAELAVGQFVYRRIEKLMDAKADTPEGRELDYLADLVGNVEEYGAQGNEDGEQWFARHWAALRSGGEGWRPAIEEIAAERRRQVEVEGWTPEHDDCHNDLDLSTALGCYALAPWRRTELYRGQRMPSPLGWPWEPAWWKPKNDRRDLIRAAALIVAEIERLDRASPSTHGEG